METSAHLLRTHTSVSAEGIGLGFLSIHPDAPDILCLLKGRRLVPLLQELTQGH